MIRALLAAAYVVLALVPTARADDALDLRLRHLESGLRCLVCQNQTLAESDADLAADLRLEVRKLALAGKSDDEIRDYLVARYGDFVLYDPPLKPVTWVLWFGPFVLLAAGTVTWIVVGRSRRRATPGAKAEFEVAARNLLAGAAASPAGAAPAGVGQAETDSGDAARQPLDG